MGKQSRRTLGALVVGLVFLLLAVAVGEIWVRRSGRVAHHWAPPRRSDAKDWRDLLHVQSPVPGLRYELSPNRRKRIRGVWIETNSHGMRDTEPLPDDTPGLVRIAVLGDSETFALTVPGDLTYPNVLERLLNERFEERGLVFDVLNFGVGGYGTRDEALVFEHKVLPWKPALVIVSYILNDPELDPVQPLIAHFHEPEWWQYSHLLRLVHRTALQRKVDRYGGGDYIAYLHADERKWRAVLNAFESIHRNASSRGIDSLLFIQPAIPEKTWENYLYADLHRQVADAARATGFDVLDLYETYARHPPASLRASPTDNHSNTDAHRLIAETLLDEVARRLADRAPDAPGELDDPPPDGDG